MDGLLVIAAGFVALFGATAILRTFGPWLRIGRLLSSAPSVTIAEANEIAASGAARYLRITGRIDSETEFTDADHRPLVFRRTRFQTRAKGRWTDFDRVVEQVPFQLNEGLDSISVDASVLGPGLVVVPRETVGVVGDLPDHAPDDLPRDQAARVVIEHVSSVEHATVAGVPVRDPDGTTRMTSGLGRPLILTTLEQPEAMRILARGSTRRPRLVAGLLLAAVVLITLGLVLLTLPGDALAASPDPTAIAGSDTRSGGEGPGIVGAPLAAALAVIGIGALSTLVTIAFVRLTGGRQGSNHER
ncbi:MAG: hypothetical protein ABIQ17_08005 [Candidatus Limnocylindrales bacterium]